MNLKNMPSKKKKKGKSEDHIEYDSIYIKHKVRQYYLEIHIGGKTKNKNRHDEKNFRVMNS